MSAKNLMLKQLLSTRILFIMQKIICLSILTSIVKQVGAFDWDNTVQAFVISVYMIAYGVSILINETH